MRKIYYFSVKHSIGIRTLFLYLIISFIFLPTGVVEASTNSESVIELETDLYERVYTEVLNGDITNETDVIKVAFAQYNERVNNTTKTCNTLKQNPRIDDSLSITQLLDTQIDKNGHKIENIMTTNLLVLDKNQNLVKASTIATGNAQLSEYSIYATMNVNVTVDTSAGTVRLNWFDTTLFYGTAITAGSLVQDSKYTPEPFWEYSDIVKQINYPQGNVAYRYIPTNMDMVTFMKFNIIKHT